MTKTATVAENLSHKNGVGRADFLTSFVGSFGEPVKSQLLVEHIHVSLPHRSQRTREEDSLALKSGCVEVVVMLKVFRRACGQTQNVLFV